MQAIEVGLKAIDVAKVSRCNLVGHQWEHAVTGALLHRVCIGCGEVHAVIIENLDALGVWKIWLSAGDAATTKEDGDEQDTSADGERAD